MWVGITHLPELHVSRGAVLTTLLLVSPGLSGCALLSTTQIWYLEEHTGRATQEQVIREFGEPFSARSLEDGGTEVIFFRYTGVTTNMLMPTDFAEPYCVEYVTRFDSDQILQQWQRRDCPAKPHAGGVDGSLVHRDADNPSRIHLFLLSYERHALLSHSVIEVPGSSR